jgi:ABC-type branched-subunit amino acid transport system substrate-binding protein
VTGSVVVAVAVSLAACSSTTSSTATTAGGGGGGSSASGIPAAAFHDTTGLTATTVRIGNVSTQLDGLFLGATVGTEAYADYVNSTGGVHGRRLVVDAGDDGYKGVQNLDLTRQDVSRDFAQVGGFSLQDSFGGEVLRAEPSVPNVTVSLSVPIGGLPNSFAPAPAQIGGQTGWLEYFKQKFPQDVAHTGALVADQPASEALWAGQLAAMRHVGYTVVYDPTFDILQSDFTANVVAMRNAGVRILILTQMPENYAAAVVRDLNQQDYHPVLVLGGSTYSEKLVPDAGGPSMIDGTYFEQNTAFFLGEDRNGIPAVGTFLHWVQQADPGFHADLYTLYGWLSAELFVQALRAAGPHPTRGSVLVQLRHITSFDGGWLTGPADPAAKRPSACYVIGRIDHGAFTRLDDPPVTGPTHGFRCDGVYYEAG